MKTHAFNKLLMPAAIAAALTSSGSFADKTADEPNPYTMPDNAWISINGTVVNPAAEVFMLDYGEGMITVEMDDWDAYGEAHALLDGDAVTVFGRVDDDLFEVASIEASSVYVKSLNTFFHANAADEEVTALPYHYVNVITAPQALSSTTLTGTVKAVDDDSDQFVIDMAGMDITVETYDLAYNPLDDMGFQQIDKGDRVSVTGSLDYEFIDGQVLHADFITTIQDASNS